MPDPEGAADRSSGQDLGAVSVSEPGAAGQGRSGEIIALPVAMATRFPSASSTRHVVTAIVRPRYSTVARATRSRPSGVTGRRKLTFRSSVPKEVPGGRVVVTAVLITVSARAMRAPP
jgi:hypothetical protein